MTSSARQCFWAISYTLTFKGGNVQALPAATSVTLQKAKEKNKMKKEIAVTP